MAVLGSLVEQIRGVSYKPEDLHSDLNADSIMLLRANNIRDDMVNFDEVVYVDRKKVTDKQLLKAGDILICTSSGSKALVGKAAYIAEDIEATFGAFCKVVRPRSQCAKYIGHFFCSPIYRERIANVAGGANINNIRNEHIDELTISLPTLAEQESISALLDSVTTLISLRKQQIAKLDELVKARFVEMFGDPVSNPKGWEMAPLSSLAEIKIGPFGSLLHKEDYVSDEHPLVNPSHIVDGRIVVDNELTVNDAKYEEMVAYHLHPGDVVLGRRGEMGRCAVVYEQGMLCGTGSLIIRPSNMMHPYFLQKIISYPTFKKAIEDMAVGVTMMNLNVPIVSSFMIPVLPRDQQDAYLAFVAQTDKQKLTIQRSLAKLELLKKALMQKYFG